MIVSEDDGSVKIIHFVRVSMAIFGETTLDIGASSSMPRQSVNLTARLKITKYLATLRKISTTNKTSLL